MIVGYSRKFSGGGSFSPTDIAGLKVWLKSDAIVGLNNGDSVTTWSDSSGIGNDVTEATNKPVYHTGGLNSKPYVQFDGTNDRLKNASATGLPTGTNGRTVFVVAQPTSLAAYQPMVAYGASGTNQVWCLAFHGTSAVLSWGYSNDDSIATTLADNTGYYFVHQYTGSNIVVRQNGAQLTSYADSIGTSGAGLYIGTYTNELYFTPMKLYEVLIYNSSLSGGNISSVESYLASKYAL